MTWPSKGRRHTRADRKITAQVLARCGGRCEIRGPNCTGTATEDDHIMPLAEGGGGELSNRRGACHACHTEKVQQEAARGRARAKHKALRPRPQHPGII